VFKNATGMHHDDQVTTARDVARILAVATNYPKFMEIFGTPNYMLDATNMFDERYLITTNHMISDESYMYYKDSRVTGGRTGTMNNGDYCLAVTASIGGGIYVAVTLGTDEYFSLEAGQPLSHGSFVDTARVLDVASASELVNVVDPEQIVTQVPVAGGDYDVVIGSRETVSCVLPANYEWNMITMRTEMVQNSLQAPIKAGTKIANAQFWYGSICIGETQLYAMIDVPVASGVQNQPEPGEEDGFDAGALSTAFMVLGVIFALILVLFGGLFLVRTLRIAMRNARSKKRRQERRRSK
jgi:D-alanyl-D-alanine carboxypeptidase